MPRPEPRSDEAWDAGRSLLTVAKVGLEVEGDGATGRVFERERIVIGSHESSDFVVRDPTVSRMHCELVPQSGRVAVRDLESKHGTSIHGVAIRQAAVTGSTVLQLGGARIRIVVGGDTVNVPLFEGTRLGRLVGRTEAMRRVLAVVERAAASDAGVLLHGEEGTGKSAVAATIHQLSARSGEPLVVVDCGGTPRDLLESELFGHEAGAVPGAPTARAGAFEVARGGSLVLDDIGELPIDLQPRLLGVLERREVRRIGAARAVPVDVRVMAATRRCLAGEVNAHRFRSDLHHRLATIHLVLPALRTHLDDLPLLVAELARRLELRADERAWLAAAQLMSELAARHWPGNVHELRDFIEACLALRTPPVIAPPSEPAIGPQRGRSAAPAIDTAQPLEAARAACLAAFERSYASELLRRHGGDIAEAARAAGTERLAFYRLLRRLDIR
jgi:DNA-binding NtrC family response regulator